MDSEHVFRYRLDGTRREPACSDRLAEMVRQQLCNILDIAQPLRGEREVDVESFRFRGPERRSYKMFNGNGAGAGSDGRASEMYTPASADDGGEQNVYGSLANAALYEPRIEFIAGQLASLLNVVELESGGEPVRVDGFRLRDPADWTGPHAASPADVFNHAATRCQYDCLFCYNHGTLESLQQPSRGVEDEWRELETRVRYYSPRAGRGLFPTFGSPYESLAHPRILPLLRELREKTGEPFRLCSNGGALDPDFVATLAELAPVHLDLSLNSSSPERRAMLMADRRPHTAITAPALLAEAGIPYAVTIVAWPYPDLEEMLRDLERTAAYADARLARLVQVNLPGYSRFFSPRELFDTGEVWGETVRLVQRLREELACPVVVSPSLYEENLTRPRLNQPEVVGVVRNSPAARWGLQAGDMVTAVNGLPVRSRPQARDLLALLQQSGAARATLSVLREGRRVELSGDTGDWAYPFDPATCPHLGAVFMGAGLRADYLERLEALVRGSDARDVLFLTSSLVRPTLEQLLRERPLSLPHGFRLGLGVPENRFFGGNIILGDLLVVQDFIDFINELPEAAQGPDLVVIPSSPFHLSGWDRDLTGRTYLDIERVTGRAVRLLKCHTIWE